MIREYRTISKINWPLMTVRGVRGVTCGESAELELASGESYPCCVLETTMEEATLLLLGQPDGLRAEGSRVRFPGHPPRLGVSEDLLGRVFSGLGLPIDGGPAVIPDFLREIGGTPCNPLLRACPSEAIALSVSGQEPVTPLLRGQTRTIHVPVGVPYAKAVVDIVRQTALHGGEDKTAIVFAGIGIRFADFETVMQSLRQTGLSERTAVFANLAEDPVFERLLTPQIAMTAAEYFAFDQGMDVIVLLCDMANYAEAMRELHAASGGMPGQWGYPPAMRDHFAALYERAGLRRGKTGSITLFPVLTLSGAAGTYPPAVITADLAEELLAAFTNPQPAEENGAAGQEMPEKM